jgi:hypothetical protein
VPPSPPEGGVVGGVPGGVVGGVPVEPSSFTVPLPTVQPLKANAAAPSAVAARNVTVVHLALVFMNSPSHLGSLPLKFRLLKSAG